MPRDPDNTPGYCKHEKLVHCPVCDAVYCEACHKEWKTVPVSIMSPNTINITTKTPPTITYSRWPHSGTPLTNTDPGIIKYFWIDYGHQCSGGQ